MSALAPGVKDCRSHAPALVLAALLPYACFPALASAYCRTRACQGEECERDPETGCSTVGPKLSWPGRCTNFSLQADGSSMVDADTAEALMQEAFDIWANAACNKAGDPPSIEVINAGPVMCDEVEFNPGEGNADVIIFRDEMWPYEGFEYELASTRVLFDGTGKIVDADMEINSTRPLKIPDEDRGGGFVVGAHDLRSIFVHEAGHFLGLDHSRDRQAIMYPSIPTGASRAMLSADDVAAICEAYPPKREAEGCKRMPRGGLMDRCGEELPQPSGCSTLRGPGHPGLGAWLWGAAWMLLAVRTIKRKVVRA